MRQKIALISLASYCLNWDGEFLKSGGLPPSRQLQFHYLYRSVGAYLQFTAIVDLTGVAEAALLHHASRGGVVGEEVAPEGTEAFLTKTVVNQKLQCLAADTLVPIGACHPVAYLGIVFSDADVAFAMEEIAHTADGFASILEFDGPHMVAVENSSYNIEAFFNAFVRRPSGTWPHLRVTGIFEQRGGIAFAPRTQ